MRADTMGAKGSFSYEPSNTNINGFTMPGGDQVRVEAVNHNVARLYITDALGNQQPVLAGGPYQLHTDTGVNVPPFNNDFLIVWVDSYVLSVNGDKKLWMTNQKQQAFSTTNDVNHFMV